MKIEKYSIGMGDRFGMAALAQLAAVQRAEQAGVTVVPVWNKSNREHTLIGSKPDDVRAEADRAVASAGWSHAYHVDADHIGIPTVDPFIASSDFFTLDVADFIGQPAQDAAVSAFASEMAPLRGRLCIPGIEAPFEVTDAVIEQVGRQTLRAVGEAGRTYRRISDKKGPDAFITEVSFDESAHPQRPIDLFFILGALAREQIPVQTIAPKFSGKFLKGIDYVGDVRQFEREFEAHVAVVNHAARVFGLPASLKLSVHTGSDKFSLYPAVRRAIRRHDGGLHLKTAGTTWLEEVVAIALGDARGLSLVKRIYASALDRFEELCRPYSTVVEIDRSKLPTASEVASFSADQFVRRVRHDASSADFSTDVRQLMHVAFKLAAELGDEYRAALVASRVLAGRLVTENLFDRHIRPLFVEA